MPETVPTMKDLTDFVYDVTFRLEQLSARIDRLGDNRVWTPAYPGQPPQGAAWWGAAIGGNSDPELRHPDHPLPLRRTFFQWRHTEPGGYLERTVAADHAAGRLPWVSIKTPMWHLVRDGAYDEQLEGLVGRLDATGLPVWLTLWHEPENDPAAGNVTQWVDMQRHTAAIVGMADEVILVPILMSWTWNPRSHRNPADWWAPDISPVWAVDHYVETETSLVDDTLEDVRQFYGEKCVDLAIGEWGMRGDDQAAGTRIRDWWNYIRGSHAAVDNRARIVAAAAFDSGLNAPTGSWELSGAQLDTFRHITGESYTLEEATA